MKYSFFNDYSEGAHPRILEAFLKTNEQQVSGYGEDTYSKEAAKLIKDKVGIQNAHIHFVSGGTQANLTVLASMLKPYEGVIAAKTAHINIHEAGAIEATGHKVLTVESSDGKLNPTRIQEVLQYHQDEHTVLPKAVFISQATELGTVYTEVELTSIAEACKKHGLYLYLDGARLGSALTSTNVNLTLAGIAENVDVFYIGGTKNGGLLGEAIVILNKNLQEHFRYHMKQRGALLAKGSVLGIQFQELFKDNLYFQLARHANEMASKLATGIKEAGYSFLTDSTTNQIFPIFPNIIIDKLKVNYGFYVWSKIDDTHSSIRLVTSWATKEQAVEDFLTNLKTL